MIRRLFAVVWLLAVVLVVVYMFVIDPDFRLFLGPLAAVGITIWALTEVTR